MNLAKSIKDDIKRREVCEQESHENPEWLSELPNISHDCLICGFSHLNFDNPISVLSSISKNNRIVHKCADLRSLYKSMVDMAKNSGAWEVRYCILQENPNITVVEVYNDANPQVIIYPLETGF